MKLVLVVICAFPVHIMACYGAGNVTTIIHRQPIPVMFGPFADSMAEFHAVTLLANGVEITLHRFFSRRKSEPAFQIFF